MYTATEVELAEWVKANTDPGSIWLTGNNHNHWVFNLTGRQAMMAYPGWLWTQGYDWRPVESDVRKMYAGGEIALSLIKKYGIDYVVISDSERHLFTANETFFDQEFPVIQQRNTVKIYQIPQE
jgi:uncharacterized membrane protein